MKEITIFLFMALCVTTVTAQSDSLLIPSMSEVYRQNSWLEGVNPVGLSFNRFRSFSLAEAGYSYRNGNLGNMSVPATNHIYNVYSESFQMLGKVSLYGKLGYVNDRKQDINWQGMTSTYWNGINLCDSMRGNQQTEQYQLSGAFSLPLDRHWLIGARFDYQVALTAKDTDPRNKNQWMEWKFAPGIGYACDRFRVGASLLYASRKETVDYQHIGTHITYPYLVAYPLGFFKTLPLSQKISWDYSAQEVGGALQAEITHGSISLFQEIEGNSTRQDIVSNRIQDKKEGEAHNWQIDYKGNLRKESTHIRHEWNWQAIFNRSTSKEPIQQQDGTDIWNTYGKVLRSTYQVSNYMFGYRYDRLYDAWNPLYTFQAGINYHYERSSLFFYPEVYTQSVRRFTLHSTFIRSIFLPHARLECALGAGYMNGGGRLIDKKQLSSGQNQPDIALWQNQARLIQEYEYRTSPRWNVNVSITYTHTEPVRWFVYLTGIYENAYKNLTDKNIKYFSVQIGLLF